MAVVPGLGTRRLWPLLLVAVAAGAVAGADAARPSLASSLADRRAAPDGAWRVRGHLVGDPQRQPTAWRVEMKIDAVLVDGSWRTWSLRVRTAVYDPAALPRWWSGDRFEAFLRFRTSRPARNPLLAPRPPLRASGIEVWSSLKSFRQLRRGSAGPRPMPALSAVRAAVRGGIDRRFGPRSAPVIRALLLGERGGVPADTSNALARTGLIHLVAISGLHVGVVIGALFGLLRLVGVVRPRAAVVCIAALPFLHAIVVPRPPVTRACLMAALVLLGLAVGRRTSALNGLAVATLAIAGADPWVVRDIGFRLSTAATASILLLCRVATTRSIAGRVLTGSLAVSCAAGLGVAPVLGAAAHRLPLFSVALNLAAVPAMSLILVTSLLCLATDAAGAGAIADLMASLTEHVLELLLRLAVAVDRHIAALAVPATAVPWIAPACLAVGASILLWRAAAATVPARRAPARALAVVTAALPISGFVAALSAAPLPPVEAFRVVAFDVGQGDALLVETPARTIVVDTGGSPLGGFDPGISILAPALRARGVRRLDGVAITHLHADHVGGLGGLLQEIAADRIWLPGIDANAGGSPLGDSLPEGSQPRMSLPGSSLRGGSLPGGSFVPAPAGDTPVSLLAAGDRVGDGPCTWSVLHPPAAWPAGVAANPNEASLVLSVGCGDRALLLTGDAGAEAERAYRNDPALLPGGVLKSGHHGSRTSSTPALLDAASPRHVLVSVGWRNRFGLPDAEVLERYRSRGMAVYRTDRDGAVTLSAGRRIRVRGERWTAGRGRYRIGGWLD